MRYLQYVDDNQVLSLRGNLPILLTAAHGGSKQPNQISERSGNNLPNNCFFNKRQDLRTKEITCKIVEAIHRLNGLAPYAVIADFHRKYIDANRRADCAYEDDKAAPFYKAYHQKIDEFRQEILQENDKKGFLFDFHGTGGITPGADFYIGTRNGGTLQPWFPREALFRREGLIGILDSIQRLQPSGLTSSVIDYDVNPNTPRQQEIPEVNGGFTVQTYSGDNLLTCIQIEIDRTIRDDFKRFDTLAEDLALAIVKSVNQFIVL